MSSLEENLMITIVNDFFLVKLVKKIIKEHKVAKQRKRIAYLDKQWDKKLRGLR